jgi:hypothetical protein
LLGLYLKRKEKGHLSTYCTCRFNEKYFIFATLSSNIFLKFFEHLEMSKFYIFFINKISDYCTMYISVQDANRVDAQEAKYATMRVLYP